MRVVIVLLFTMVRLTVHAQMISDDLPGNTITPGNFRNFPVFSHLNTTPDTTTRYWSVHFFPIGTANVYFTIKQLDYKKEGLRLTFKCRNGSDTFYLTSIMLYGISAFSTSDSVSPGQVVTLKQLRRGRDDFLEDHQRNIFYSGELFSGKSSMIRKGNTQYVVAYRRKAWVTSGTKFTVKSCMIYPGQVD